MPKKDELVIEWLETPNDHDYPSAASFLSLIYDEKTSLAFIEKLKTASVTHYKAKDLFRASNLSLLGVSNLHVRRDIKKIKSKEALSPILLVRDTAHGRVIIADGYHRLCAVYKFDEDALIPCKIV